MDSGKLVLLLLRLLLVIICALAAASRGQAQPEAVFKCTTEGQTCRSLVDYSSPNSTTLRRIQTLFNVKHLLDLVGANGLPGTTTGNYTVKKNEIIKIPFRCMCSNGTGLSNRLPIYTIQKDDTLSHLATDVFSGLVSYQKIEQVNNISDPTKIQPGQKVWIPLPCSCDPVNNTSVVHYGHLVATGNSIEQIALDYGTTQDTLLRLNGISDPKSLQAGQILDVPLTACSSMVTNNSSDFPLLVGNGTEIYTANGCVKCSCNSANNWTLQCEASQVKPYNWSTCPSTQCNSSTSTNVPIGNTTSTDSCSRTFCAYTGYTSQNISTSLVTQSTCPAVEGSGGSGAPRSSLRGWGWNHLFIAIHMILFCVCPL